MYCFCVQLPIALPQAWHECLLSSLMQPASGRITLSITKAPIFLTFHLSFSFFAVVVFRPLRRRSNPPPFPSWPRSGGATSPAGCTRTGRLTVQQSPLRLQRCDQESDREPQERSRAGITRQQGHVEMAVLHQLILPQKVSLERLACSFKRDRVPALGPLA